MPSCTLPVCRDAARLVPRCVSGSARCAPCHAPSLAAPPPSNARSISGFPPERLPRSLRVCTVMIDERLSSLTPDSVQTGKDRSRPCHPTARYALRSCGRWRGRRGLARRRPHPDASHVARWHRSARIARRRWQDRGPGAACRRSGRSRSASSTKSFRSSAVMRHVDGPGVRYRIAV